MSELMDFLNSIGAGTWLNIRLAFFAGILVCLILACVWDIKGRDSWVFVIPAYAFLSVILLGGEIQHRAESMNVPAVAVEDEQELEKHKQPNAVMDAQGVSLYKVFNNILYNWPTCMPLMDDIPE